MLKEVPYEKTFCIKAVRFREMFKYCHPTFLFQCSSLLSSSPDGQYFILTSFFLIHTDIRTITEVS